MMFRSNRPRAGRSRERPVLITIPDDRAVTGVGLKPGLELELLRSEVLAARGYSEVDGDGPAVHPAIMYDFIGASNRILRCSKETPKESGHSPIISTNPSSRTTRLIAPSPAGLSLGFCIVAIVTPKGANRPVSPSFGQWLYNLQGYRRSRPRPPPKPPDRFSRGLASLTVRVRPSRSVPFRASIAFSASAESISTKPKPFDRPVILYRNNPGGFDGPVG